MRRLRAKPVHILLHPDFFKSWDNNRRQYSQKIGCEISHVSFSEILAKSNTNLMPSMGGSKDGFRKKRRRI
jgi:hypothetical protein